VTIKQNEVALEQSEVTMKQCEAIMKQSDVALEAKDELIRKLQRQLCSSSEALLSTHHFLHRVGYAIFHDVLRVLQLSTQHKDVLQLSNLLYVCVNISLKSEVS